MFPVVKEFKSFQWHSSSHTYLTRKAPRHTGLQHLPHASFFPHKLHHPTPLDIPPAGRLSTSIADAVVVEVKPLQTAVFFELLSQGLAVSGRQHRDGLPFSTAKAQEQIRGKSTGGARPKPTSSEWESIGNLSQAGWQKKLCLISNMRSPEESDLACSTRICLHVTKESVCWALFFGFVKDLQGELVRLLNLQYLNCAVAQLLTRPCQTTPFKSSIIIGPRTCSKYVEPLCSSRVTRKVWKCVKYHRPTASASLDQILRGGCTKPVKLPHVVQKSQCKSFGAFWIHFAASATAGRKSMPEFSSQCRGRKSRNQHI